MFPPGLAICIEVKQRPELHKRRRQLKPIDTLGARTLSLNSGMADAYIEKIVSWRIAARTLIKDERRLRAATDYPISRKIGAGSAVDMSTLCQ